jgi:hypothetical protein
MKPTKTKNITKKKRKKDDHEQQLYSSRRKKEKRKMSNISNNMKSNINDLIFVISTKDKKCKIEKKNNNTMKSGGNKW